MWLMLSFIFMVVCFVVGIITNAPALLLVSVLFAIIYQKELKKE